MTSFRLNVGTASSAEEFLLRANQRGHTIVGVSGFKDAS
jgi:hypothetical protein